MDNIQKIHDLENRILHTTDLEERFELMDELSLLKKEAGTLRDNRDFNITECIGCGS